jgi:hypothetical protein
LNADASANTTRREKVQQRKKRTTPTTQTTTKRVPFQTTNKNNRTKRVRLVTQREPRVDIYIQQHTTTEGAVANKEGEREYTYCNPSLSPPPYSRWTRPD